MTLTKETLRTFLLPRVRQSLQRFKSIIYKGKSWFIQTHWTSRANSQSNLMDERDFQEVRSASPMFVEKSPSPWCRAAEDTLGGLQNAALGSSTFWYTVDMEKLSSQTRQTQGIAQKIPESISSETEGKAWRWELEMTHLLSLLKKMKLDYFPLDK